MLRGIRNMKSLPNGRLFVSQGSPCRGAGSRRLTEWLLQICDDLSVSAAPSHRPWKGRLGICASQWLPLIGEALGVRRSQASPSRGGGSAKPRRRGRCKFDTTSRSAFGCQLPCKWSHGWCVLQGRKGPPRRRFVPAPMEGEPFCALCALTGGRVGRYNRIKRLGRLGDGLGYSFV